MMILIWFMLLKPTDVFWQSMLSSRYDSDLHTLIYTIYGYRIASINLEHDHVVAIDRLCRDWMPYARCQWRGLDRRGWVYYAGSRGRYSPGALKIIACQQCIKLFLSAYGLVRIGVCD